MGRRSDPRIEKVLAVRVRGTDRSGSPFVQDARTLDISSTGARLDWVGSLLMRGQTIEVQHGRERADFRVVWVGRPGTFRAGQIGIRCLEPGRCIWGVDLPLPRPDNYQPPRPPAINTAVKVGPPWSGKERRRQPRFRCMGRMEVRVEGKGVPLTGSLADISLIGCYVEMLSPLPVNTRLEWKLTAEETEIQGRGVVEVSHPSLGMGIFFTRMEIADRTRLRELVDRVANQPETGPSVVADGPEPKPHTLNVSVTSPQPLSIPEWDAPIALEALLSLLERKGVVTREELFEELNKNRNKP